MLDFIIFIVLMVFVFSGFFRGARKEISSTLNTIVFIFLSYIYAYKFGYFIFKKIDIYDSEIPDFVIIIFGIILIFIFSSIFFYFLRKTLITYFLNFENKFLDRLFSTIFSFFKGFFIISIFFSFLDHYEMISFIKDFDENSLLLDYLLKFSVQLQNVWNHWNS